jgi:hypothetical protein
MWRHTFKPPRTHRLITQRQTVNWVRPAYGKNTCIRVSGQHATKLCTFAGECTDVYSGNIYSTICTVSITVTSTTVTDKHNCIREWRVHAKPMRKTMYWSFNRHERDQMVPDRGRKVERQWVLRWQHTCRVSVENHGTIIQLADSICATAISVRSVCTTSIVSRIKPPFNSCKSTGVLLTKHVMSHTFTGISRTTPILPRTHSTSKHYVHSHTSSWSC